MNEVVSTIVEAVNQLPCPGAPTQTGIVPPAAAIFIGQKIRGQSANLPSIFSLAIIFGLMLGRLNNALRLS